MEVPCNITFLIGVSWQLHEHPIAIAIEHASSPFFSLFLLGKAQLQTQPFCDFAKHREPQMGSITLTVSPLFFHVHPHFDGHGPWAMVGIRKYKLGLERSRSALSSISPFAVGMGTTIEPCI